MWPSSVILSAYLTSSLTPFSSLSCLELGAGCGLTSLSLSNFFQSIVTTDFNPLVVSNMQNNIAINDLSSTITATTLDFYQQSGTSTFWVDTLGNHHPQVDYIVAADVVCNPSDAVAAAKSLHDALKYDGNATVVSNTDKHRFGVELFQSECEKLGMVCSREVWGVVQVAKLSCSQSLSLCSGYVPGMEFYVHFIKKRPSFPRWVV